VAQLARERQVEVVRDTEGVTDPIRTDLAKITEVMTEVIGNAVKFTSKGTVRITASCGQGRLVCQVADSGIGIAPDDLEHVFDEFYQVDESGDRGFHGAGLGLSIAKRLVELLQGTIAITSEIGEGTTVTISLPVHPAPPGAPA
jgi:signal transduction histidine kinase